MALAVAASIATGGCVAQVQPPPPLRAPRAASKYYVLTVEVDKQAKQAALNNRAESLTDDAAALINRGIKVAFQPPDACFNTTATPEGAEKKAEYLRLECGVLMTSIELAAARAGYQVVSWQGLKDRDLRPLEKAKQLQVDLLVEVNELTANERRSGSSSYTGLAFSEQSSATDRRLTQVSPDVAGRCKAGIDAAVADGSLKLDENSATLDAKAVDVRTGRAVWYYSKTIRDDVDRPDVLAQDYFFEAPSSEPPLPPPPPAVDRYNKLQRGGGAALASGLVGVGGGAGLYALEVSEAGGAALMSLGATAVGLGIALLITGNQRAKRFNRAAAAGATGPRTATYTPTYPDAAQVLCAVPPVVPAFAAPAFRPEGPTSPTTSSTYSFREDTGGSADAERALRERLFNLIATDFVGELTKLN